MSEASEFKKYFMPSVSELNSSSTANFSFISYVILCGDAEGGGSSSRMRARFPATATTISTQYNLPENETIINCRNAFIENYLGHSEACQCLF